jgi:predicted DNA-binding transcriptional regulator AlpA
MPKKTAVHPDIDKEADEVYLTGPQLKLRFGGVTDFTLHRWLNHKTLDFPKPIYIGTKRYWRLSDLVAYERKCASRPLIVAETPVMRRHRERREKAGA